jgi:hypothetical protein
MEEIIRLLDSLSYISFTHCTVGGITSLPFRTGQEQVLELTEINHDMRPFLRNWNYTVLRITIRRKYHHTPIVSLRSPTPTWNTTENGNHHDQAMHTSSTLNVAQHSSSSRVAYVSRYYLRVNMDCEWYVENSLAKRLNEPS